MSGGPARLARRRSAKPPRASAREVTAFTRQLTSLLHAGLPLVQALDLIARAERRNSMPDVARGMARRIAGGEPFATALAAYPEQFDPIYRALSAIGEASGSLALVLARIVEHRERAAAQRGKLRSALAYPCAVLVLAVGVTAALLAFVVPTFQQVFQGFGAELPGPTRAVIALSNALLRWGPLSLAACGALWLIAARLVRRSLRVRRTLDRALLSLPAVGDVARAIAAARWSRALGTLLTSGTPLADALLALSHVTGNVVFHAANTQIVTRLRRGEHLAAAMRAVGCFPEAFVEAIEVAEESSALDTMLLDCAALAEREVDEKLAFACACTEPVVVTLLGLAVGGLVIALYLPVIEMGNVV